MKAVRLSGVFATTLLLAAGCQIEGEANPPDTLFAEEGGGGHGGGHYCQAEAVMLSGDYNADGAITAADVEIIEAAKDAGDYAAYWDMTDDGVLDGRDVAAVAQNVGDAASPRDAQMVALWNATLDYHNVLGALADGYIPFTPNLHGHGIHFVRLDLVFNWASRGGFDAGVPEGLNFDMNGNMIAAFYYGLSVTDMNNLRPDLFPVPGLALANIAPPNSFHGVMGHTWHQHVGACFGRFTGGAIPTILADNEDAMAGLTGFQQCMTQADCESYDPIPGQNVIWSPQFHMLHAWITKRNECGVFGGIDPTVSHHAPHEPNHGLCTVDDVVTLPLVPVPPLF